MAGGITLVKTGKIFYRLYKQLGRSKRAKAVNSFISNLMREGRTLWERKSF
jgi:hypothetical protein